MDTVRVRATNNILVPMILLEYQQFLLFKLSKAQRVETYVGFFRRVQFLVIEHRSLVVTLSNDSVFYDMERDKER